MSTIGGFYMYRPSLENLRTSPCVCGGVRLVLLLLYAEEGPVVASLFLVAEVVVQHLLGLLQGDKAGSKSKFSFVFSHSSAVLGSDLRRSSSTGSRNLKN